MIKYTLPNVFGLVLIASLWCFASVIAASSITSSKDADNSNRTISLELFETLDEFARLEDISYCVGNTGVHKPFSCLSRCQDFPNFELVTVSFDSLILIEAYDSYLQSWNTGPFFSDSCGFIALSHPPSLPRIIVAFRGTYSITNTIADLSTFPQEYMPYPGDDATKAQKCQNCTVHAGFMTSWKNARPEVLPHLQNVLLSYPHYQLVLVGHSLGGAVAALAGMEFIVRGWNPYVITFGEPRLGNAALSQYLDSQFDLTDSIEEEQRYRRVTHFGDPVPLLPLKEWDYTSHGGEIFISKSKLPPRVEDVWYCMGDEDIECSASKDVLSLEFLRKATLYWLRCCLDDFCGLGLGFVRQKSCPLSAPRALWRVLSAHRDYFWRLGLCVPGGDPHGW